MAQPGNFRIFAFFLVLALAAPVSADLASTPVVFSGNATAQAPVPYTITLFIPTATMVHSNQVMDLISGPNNTVLLATSFGLSMYNGTWSTRHMTTDNVSLGLLDDFVTSVEYDHAGNLWIGYSEGIQIFNGYYYRTIHDQQLLKDLRIKDLLRWNDDMWIATGNSGIHRYRNGEWTWYQPFSKGGGPGFYEINSMTLDPVANMTLIATETEGLWMIPSQEDPVHFICIAPRLSGYGELNRVKRDPQGGVLFFNKTTVVHYSASANFTPVLSGRNLSITDPEINDLAAAADGKLFLATDQGIYIWDHDRIYRHLDRFEGIGTSSIVRSIGIDSLERVWFSTPDNVGYYIDRRESPATIAIHQGTPAPAPDGTGSSPGSSPGTIPPLPTPANGSALSATPDQSAGAALGPVDSIIRSIRSFFIGIGLKPRF